MDDVEPPRAADLDETDGLAPLFRPHDGANRPDADVSTLEARRASYSMARTRAVTRFTRTIPATADFVVDAVDDPDGWSTKTAFSSFRRPPPTANVAHEVSITWTGTQGDMMTKLIGIMNGATKSHAQRATDLPAEQQLAGAQFMFGLSFAPAVSRHAGALDAAGALGGPENLASSPFYIGMNALTGDSQTHAPFNPESFEVFAAWEGLEGGPVNRARAQNRTRRTGLLQPRVRHHRRRRPQRRARTAGREGPLHDVPQHAEPR